MNIINSLVSRFLSGGDEDPGVDSYTLKFGAYPIANLTHSYELGSLAATVRYKDEKGISDGDTLLMADSDGNVFGVAGVYSAMEVPVEHAMELIHITDSFYPLNSVDDLLQELNGYYDEPIGYGSTVKVIIFFVYDLELEEINI